MPTYMYRIVLASCDSFLCKILSSYQSTKVFSLKSFPLSDIYSLVSTFVYDSDIMGGHVLFEVQ